MENTRIIKVAWICMVSNERLRSHLDSTTPFWYKTISFLYNRKTIDLPMDYGQWNTNAIKEFEKIKGVDLHVIFVHSGMNKWLQVFKENGIQYYAVSKGTPFMTLARRLFKCMKPHFRKTHRIIAQLIRKIHPDIIHIMGAENPPYSPAIHYLPKDTPILVQLQTMLQDPVAIEFYPALKEQKECEYEVLMRADYIGSNIEFFNQTIRSFVKSNAVFVNIGLLTGEKFNETQCEKEHDFVYFASHISKSIDLVIEAFGIAHKVIPTLTLDVVGGVSDDEKRAIVTRIEELGCKDAVSIEGRLPTHDDVVLQIKKSRFALLPLKIDIVSSTIREAMWSGLPVVTTITQGTPLLNKKRESVLLSETGNHKALADNMIRLYNNPKLAQLLQKNALITVEEEYGNNAMRAHEWVSAYHACIDNFRRGIPIPEELIHNS